MYNSFNRFLFLYSSCTLIKLTKSVITRDKLNSCQESNKHFKHIENRRKTAVKFQVPYLNVHTHNLGNNIGWGRGDTKSTRGISSQVKKSSYKKREDWFEPVLSVYTTLSSTLLSDFVIYPSSTQ